MLMAFALCSGQQLTPDSDQPISGPPEPSVLPPCFGLMGPDSKLASLELFRVHANATTQFGRHPRTGRRLLRFHAHILGKVCRRRAVDARATGQPAGFPRVISRVRGCEEG